MESVSMSPKGQLVIPKALRQRAGIERGGTLTVRVEKGRIILEPVPTSDDGWRHWRGVLAGTDALQQHLTEHRDEVRQDS